MVYIFSYEGVICNFFPLNVLSVDAIVRGGKLILW